MNEPKLRFKADDGNGFPEWETKEISSYLSIRNEKQVPTEEAPLKAFIANMGVADKGDRYDRSFLVKSEDKKYKRTELNDFIYSSNNLDVGSIGLNTYGTAVISDVYEVFKTNENVVPTVLDLAIQRKAVISAILRFRQGCLYGQYRIYPEDFLSVEISMPSFPEQQKIADFISKLDAIIEQTQSEIDAWEKQKRGVMQLLFSRKVRFKADDGSEFPEWENTTLGDLGQILMCRRIYKEQTLEYGPVPFYKIGTFGRKPDAYISRELYEEYKAKYPFPEVGNILISASGSIGKAVEYKGADEYFQDSNIVWLKHDDRVLDSFLKQFYSITEWEGLEGSTIKRLYNKIILETPISLPAPEEQRKIAACLSGFDDVIDKTKKELEAYRELKKGLLQQMFV